MFPDLDRLNLLLSLSRYAEGEKAAREAIGENPEWGAGYGFLALFLSNQGHHLPAVRAARDCVAKEPHDPWAHAVRATVLRRLGRNDEALAAADEAIRIDHTYAYAYHVRCDVLCAEQRYREARVTAIDGLQHHPTDEGLLQRKGWAEQMTGRLDAAIWTAEAALKLHPDSPSLRNVVGCARMDMADGGWLAARIHNYRQADAMFREAIRLRPGESAYQDNRRLNALRCRQFVVKAVLPGLMLVSALLVAAPGVVAARGGGVVCCFAMVGLFAYIPGLSHLNAGEPWFFLSAPVKWLGLPTVPLPSDEARKGRWAWRGVIGVLVAMPAVAWALVLASRI